MINFLAVGCSLTKDNYQLTWPDYLSQSLNYKLTNIGARGAGINFLSKRVIYHCLHNSVDFIVIMLPSIDRFDWYVDQHSPLKQSALDIASWQNGKISELVQIDGTLSKECGYVLSGGEIRGDKKYWYKYYYNESGALLEYWNNVYNLENFFKNQKIKYYFTMAYDRDYLVEQLVNKTGHDQTYEFLFDIIDWTKFIFYKENRGFLSFVQDNHYKNISNNHPESLAHKSWVEQILIPKI